MKYLAIIAFLLISSISPAQSVSYNDVGVIVNDNSQESVNVGNYFQASRNIPNQNIIHITAPTTEEIDSAQFEHIRLQVELYLVNNNLTDSLNYLVTTKGVPLKVARSNCQSIPAVSSCASFDAEIGLILGPLSPMIGQPSPVLNPDNPYYHSTQSFSRDVMGFYLVTRLDGYTEQDIFAMIDRSGPGTLVNKNLSKEILDVSGWGANNQTLFNYYYMASNDLLNLNNWQVIFDSVPGYITDETNVLAFAGTLSQTTGIDLNYSWEEGSFTILYSDVEVGFDSISMQANEIGLGELIAEGCTGGHSYVYTAYSTIRLETEILFDRYLNSNGQYNLAESYYMADQHLSWNSVIIGDPKATVLIDSTANVVIEDFDPVLIYPNPNQGEFVISGENIQRIEIYDAQGKLIYQSDQVSDKNLVNLSMVQSGVYLCKIYTSGNVFRKRFLKEY